MVVCSLDAANHSRPRPHEGVPILEGNRYCPVRSVAYSIALISDCPIILYTFELDAKVSKGERSVQAKAYVASFVLLSRKWLCGRTSPTK